MWSTVLIGHFTDHRSLCGATTDHTRRLFWTSVAVQVTGWRSHGNEVTSGCGGEESGQYLSSVFIVVLRSRFTCAYLKYVDVACFCRKVRSACILHIWLHRGNVTKVFDSQTGLGEISSDGAWFCPLRLWFQLVACWPCLPPQISCSNQSVADRLTSWLLGGRARTHTHVRARVYCTRTDARTQTHKPIAGRSMAVSNRLDRYELPWSNTDLPRPCQMTSHYVDLHRLEFVGKLLASSRLIDPVPIYFNHKFCQLPEPHWCRSNQFLSASCIRTQTFIAHFIYRPPLWGTADAEIKVLLCR